MRRSIPILTAMALVLVLAWPAGATKYDLPAYGSLRWGMTMQQVARYYPQMKRVSNRLVILGQRVTWLGARWIPLALFSQGRLARIEILTRYNKAHYIKVFRQTTRDLGQPKKHKNLAVWIQSQRIVVLGWTKLKKTFYTAMRFIPRPKKAPPVRAGTTPPTTGPGTPPYPTAPPGTSIGAPIRWSATAVPVALKIKAVGVYKDYVAKGRFVRRRVSGQGTTAAQAVDDCNVNMMRLIALAQGAAVASKQTKGKGPAPASKLIVKRCKVRK